MSEKQEMSRRTFLNYALMGTGAFLVAGVTTPMVRFAIDPMLKASAGGDKVPVGNVSDFGPEPKRIEFKKRVEDGWNKTESVLVAWVRTLEDGTILALSPVCKHLGCTVDWNSSPDHANEYFCACHLGRYNINGQNVIGTPPTRSLDEYEVEVQDGKLYVGAIIPNERPGVNE